MFYLLSYARAGPPLSPAAAESRTITFPPNSAAAPAPVNEKDNSNK